MYTLLRDSLSGVRTRERSTTGARARIRLRVSRNVFFLGMTSLFTDISSESVSSILPLYFVVFLRFSPFSYGVVDGLYQGSSALVRLLGGFTADRWRRHKEVAAAGYGLSAVCKLGLLAAGGAWTAVTGVLLLDRAGKGVRTAPRDALISLSSRPEALGMAFGVHRALDTAGALLGPLLAFTLFSYAPGAFDAVFVASFCAALIGLGFLVLFVENHADVREQAARPPVSLRGTGALLVRRRFLALVVVGGLLGVGTISDGFLYLMLQRRLDFAIGFFPLLYVATAVAYFALAVPAGWLADRIGRGRVFVAGHVLLLAVYVALLRPSAGAAEIAVYVALFGAFYAATDGVLMALASAVLPAEQRGSGMALLTTVTSLARLAGSVLLGALWTLGGPEVAVAVLLTGLSAAIVVAALALIPHDRRTAHEQVATS